MAFRDGTLALPPIAPVEVQGYVYDAKLRIAEIAREIWRDDGAGREARARRGRATTPLRRGVLARGAGLLRTRTRPREAPDRLTDLESRASALERHRPGSSAGNAIADLLMGDALWSGWGVRTMAVGEGAYNPLVYHDGTVWPHDNSLVAWGLAHERPAGTTPLVSSERWSRRRRTSTTGCRRSSPASRVTRPRFPVVYPTASSPQAWAAATPILLLQAVLGLVPDRAERVASLRGVARAGMARGALARRASTRSVGAGRCASREGKSSWSPRDRRASPRSSGDKAGSRAGRSRPAGTTGQGRFAHTRARPPSWARLRRPRGSSARASRSSSPGTRARD